MHIVQKTPFGKPLDFLFPAMPNTLESVAHFAVEGAMGNLDAE